MANFNYLSYATVYSSTYDDILLNCLERRACYGDTLRHPPFTDMAYGSAIKDKVFCVSYNIYVSMGTSLSEHDDSNNCIIARETVDKFIHELQELQPFECTIDDEPDLEDLSNLWKNSIMLKVKVDGSYMAHKFILTALRYLWESPYNFCLWEAERLQKKKEFSKESLLFLCILVMNTLGLEDIIHMLGRDQIMPKYITHESIQKAFEDAFPSMNNLFDEVALSKETIEDSFHFIPYPRGGYSTERLDNPEYKKERDDCYSHNYSIILDGRV